MTAGSALQRNPSRDDFAALLEESFLEHEITEGSVVKGRVVAIEKDVAVIDIGAKTEGRVALKTDAASLVFQSLDVPLQSRSTLSQIPGIGTIAGSLMSAGLDVVGPSRFGFDMQGMVSVKVTSTFVNRLLPMRFMDDRFHWR